MGVNVQKVPRARGDISVQELGDEVMLHDSVNEKIHVLNHSAYAILKLCNGENTVEDIHACMSVQFPDAGSNLMADIEATVRELKEKMLFI